MGINTVVVETKIIFTFADIIHFSGKSDKAVNMDLTLCSSWLWKVEDWIISSTAETWETNSHDIAGAEVTHTGTYLYLKTI